MAKAAGGTDILKQKVVVSEEGESEGNANVILYTRKRVRGRRHVHFRLRHVFQSGHQSLLHRPKAPVLAVFLVFSSPAEADRDGQYFSPREV